MINLVKNAIKFTPRKGKIDIITNYCKEKELLKVGVRDSGAGISEEDKKKLFTHFGRLQRT